MAAPARRATAPSEDRLWLARALLVLIHPRPVFAALRDDFEDAARARQEPILAIVGLAGIAPILLTTTAGGGVGPPPATAGLAAPLGPSRGGAFTVFFVSSPTGAPPAGGPPPPGT